MDIILMVGVILIVSALSCKLLGKIGLPTLVGFILIGVIIRNLFNFDSVDMATVDSICTFALLLIVFTGGFQTNFSEAKPVLAVSSVLSVAGTLLTAALAGSFAYFILGLEFYPSILLGVIISSTDVASVSSVLRSRNIELKHNLGSVLEIESGSNEPFAHILTVVLIALAVGAGNAPLLLVTEIFFGVVAGVLISKFGRILINRLNVEMDNVYGVLLCGVAFLIFGVASFFHGSGFLAVYIGGLILGNGKLVHKGSLSKLYSVISMLMQILLFIILGMLFVPTGVVTVIGSALLFALFLFFVARPLVVFALMKPFKHKLNEIAFVSWAGFRGAASIVFATHLLTENLPYATDVFNIVFFVCMLSAILQSPFIVPIANKLKLHDD
ncbi:MAG: potassium/proton antiporter [Clostridiales bacterium]|jgi:cell volume regulation protein A|nr:potassium/proton antiporter [Clostridiales bacterium]